MAGKKRLSGAASGETVKLRYLGDSEEILEFEGVITRTGYKVGGRINIAEVDTADLSTGQSWAPGLLQLSGPSGKLFEIHVPLKEEIEAEAEAQARKEEAWKNTEALALPAEGSEKPKRRKVKPKVEPDGEGAVSGD